SAGWRGIRTSSTGWAGIRSRWRTPPTSSGSSSRTDSSRPGASGAGRGATSSCSCEPGDVGRRWLRRAAAGSDHGEAAWSPGRILAYAAGVTRFGVALPTGGHSGVPPTAHSLADAAREIERAGFGSAWAFDSVGRGFLLADPLTSLAVAATVTRQI